MNLGKRKADIQFIIDVILLFRGGIIKPAGGYKNINTYGMFKSYFKIDFTYQGLELSQRGLLRKMRGNDNDGCH
jgi:hypothetical protein